MSYEQLYYPNLQPKIDAKLAISFLHWDRVMRIYPVKGSAKFRPSSGIINELEKEKILVSEPLDYEDIQHASKYFDRIVSIVNGPLSEKSMDLERLIRPRPKILNKNSYYIYEGKADHYFPRKYPQYFESSKDLSGNEIFLCSKETGLTYMTLLAHFLCQRKAYKNTITDNTDAFPLFVTLNKYLDLSNSDKKMNKFVPAVKAAKEVEKIFYLPLLKVLEPADFDNEKTLERIISFRADKDNDRIRKEYLEIIDRFLTELYACKSQEEATELINNHEKKFQSHLKILISACKQKGIPVNEKIINYGDMSTWELAGKAWDQTSKMINLITKNSISLVKPLLQTKPSIDFYNHTLKNSEYCYPLLIQETFAPTISQKIFKRINQFDKINL
ncbi:MAG: hypothetical protein WA081_17555 [Desulfosalsimonadaceae bacterium]